MTAEQYIKRMRRNLLGSVIIMLAHVVNLVAGSVGIIPPDHYTVLSVLLFGCAVLTVYWTRKDRKLSPFYKGKK